MKNKPYILLSLLVLLLASCTALPSIAPAPADSQQGQGLAPAATEPAPVAPTPAVPATVAATGALTATSVITPTTPPAAEGGATPTSEQVMGANPLVGVVWEWAALIKAKLATQTVVPNPSSYTLIFGDAGEVLFKADCNSGNGTYTLTDDVLKITPGAMTRVACPPGSLSNDMVTALGQVTSYLIDGGDLVLRLGETGDSLLFLNGGPSAQLAEPPVEATPTPVPAPIGETPTVAAPAATDAPPVVQPPAASTPPLLDTVWQWEQLVPAAAGGERITVENPANYTVTFMANGTVAMKADCNQAAGTYKVEGSALTVEVGPVTLAACAPGSLFDVFLIDITSAASYTFEGGKLNVDLLADGGRMVFGAAK